MFYCQTFYWFSFYYNCVPLYFPECIKPHPRVKFSSDLPTYIDVWTLASAMSRTLVMRKQRFQALFSTCACWTLTLLCSVNTRTNFVQLFLYTGVFKKTFLMLFISKDASVYKVWGRGQHEGWEKNKQKTQLFLVTCLFLLSLTVAVQHGYVTFGSVLIIKCKVINDYCKMKHFLGFILYI